MEEVGSAFNLSHFLFLVTLWIQLVTNGIKCCKGNLLLYSGSDLSQFTILNHFILSACKVETFIPTLQIGELRLKRIKKLECSYNGWLDVRVWTLLS